MTTPYSGYPPPRPQKPRPGVWWFFLGGGLLVLAMAVGIGAFVLVFSSFLGTDVTVDADGETHAVSVPTDRDRMLWVEEQGDDPGCTIVDTETGEPVELRSPGGSFTRGNGSGDWEGRYRFDPGSGELEVTCGEALDPTASVPDPNPQVQIGPAPKIGQFVGGLLVGILVPIVLGLTGVVILVVTTVLFATRPARARGGPSA